jgi:DNA-binding transcriptional regulator LsrR (DeoR family)
MGEAFRPREEKLDLAARAAWLYYVSGDTQQEIAKKLKISRPAAQRLVALALEEGVVKVQIHHRVTRCLELGRELHRRFALKLCEVVPVDGDDLGGVLRKVSLVGAKVLEDVISSKDPRIVCVSAARTIKAAVNEMRAIRRPQHRLISLVGTIAHDGSNNRFDVAMRIAEKTGCTFHLLPAPLLADSPEERSQWCSHRLYRLVEDLAARADAAFVGIGEVGVGCPMYRDGFITRQELAGLNKAGAVGETLGWFFDAQGEEIQSPISHRVTSIPKATLIRAAPIAFAAGVKKARAVSAALQGGWIRGLVTDEACARRVLDLN